MEQIDSTSTNPENGLNLQPALSPEEEFYNLVKDVMKKRRLPITIAIKKRILAYRCPKLTKINFAKVMDLIPEDDRLIIADILITIASNATNMSDFQIMDGYARKQQFTLWSMSEKMVSAFAKMSKLKILKVRHFSISFSSLMELSGKLPSLKNLYFKIEAEPNFEISNLDVFEKNFKHLEIFQFSPVSNESEWDEEFRKSLTLECIRYLPNLKVLGDPKYFVDMLPTCLYYESLATTDQSKLKYLVLRVDRKILKNALSKFPDVEYLHINWVNQNQPHLGFDVPELLEFEHLTILTMSGLATKYSVYIKRFLNAYGERLTRLTLAFKSHPIDFVWLFNIICSSSFDNLKLLAMTNLDVEPFTVTKEGKRGNCQLDCVVHQHFREFSCDSLKEIKLEFVSEQSSNQTYVHLSKILSVPNLEKVSLIRVPTTLDELWETMLLVTKRAILKKVTNFVLQISNEQIVEGEIVARTRCCQTIEEELLSDKRRRVRCSYKSNK